MSKSIHFKIIVPFYNVEKWIKKNIENIKSQSYKNFQCIVVDDMSIDASAILAKEEIGHDDRFIFVENNEKKYALKNIHEAIELSNPSPEDIVVTLDGDDWFAHCDVLSMLESEYATHNCWMTYGSYVEYPSGMRGSWANRIQQHIIKNNTFRSSPWSASHLRTFKNHLWDRIEKRDLIDSGGNFYRMAWDLAFMFPMLEMSGPKSRYIEDILYVYNVSNPLNDHKIDNVYQVSLEKEIRNKKKYSKVEREENTA